MISSVVSGAHVAALGHYLPATVVSNATVAARLDVDSDWILARTGIRERRISAPHETVADMATAAARHALAVLDADSRYIGRAENIDTVIVATVSAESTMPSTAARVAGRLGLRGPATFDLNSACAGFCHALAVADGLVRTGTSRGALVIGADKSTAYLDWADRNTAILFADGAGAAVVLEHDLRAIGPVRWGSLGQHADLITIDPRRRVIRQDGRSVYRWAISLGNIASDICNSVGIKPSDLAAFIPHQANLRIITALANDLHLEGVEVATDVTDTGNTMAATIPIALSRMVNGGRLANGGSVLLFGFGSGLAYAGQVITLDAVAAGPAIGPT